MLKGIMHRIRISEVVFEIAIPKAAEGLGLRRWRRHCARDAGRGWTPG